MMPAPRAEAGRAVETEMHVPKGLEKGKNSESQIEQRFTEMFFDHRSFLE
jgi:hypothetical protein